MKIFRLPLLLLIIITISSCKKDKEGSLTLNFIAHYDGQPLEMFGIRPSILGEQVLFSHLSFLISDLKLLDPSNEEYLKEVELVDLSFDDVDNATEGFTIHIDQIPAKSYSGISFGIGVPADLNSKSPAEFPSSNPLSKTGFYWEAWQSFIFLKIEGRLDTLGNGIFDTSFAFHTGTDGLYRILQSTTIPVNIEDGKDTEINIAFDYKDLLEGIDIKADPQNHNPEDSTVITRIVNNLPNAVILFQ